MIKRPLLSLVLLVPALGIAMMPVDAHRRWLLPSATVLSGEEETVSVDAASSNGLFYFEHRASGLDDLVVTDPEGATVEANIIGSGAYRSVFDVPLKKQGTYRIALASEGVFGSYMLNGERQRVRGANPEIPEGATEVNINPVSSRVETFVTLGAPNETALQATGKGLELLPVTHPNDLVVGEAAQLKFVLDGAPVAGLEVEFVKGDTRYRDDAGIRTFTTDADGMIEVSVDEPGMYYLEASQGPERGEPGRRASYVAVLEFLPL